jgi:RNA polymerase sigma-70 factor (ECF subfamily)
MTFQAAPAGIIEGGTVGMTDESLIESYYGCDNTALEALWLRHRAPLIGYFINGGLAREAAEDAAQEVWARVMNTKHRLGDRGGAPFDAARGVPFGAWLYIIAHHLLLDIRERQGRAHVQMPVGAEGEDSLEVDLLSREEPSDTSLATQELREVIRACMEELPDNERRILALELARGDLEVPPRQVEWAEQHGLTHRTYTAALNRARARLRECVSKKLGETVS